MPLLAQEHLPISSKDLISWCYENREKYDQDKPIFIDTVTAETISARQAYVFIRKLVAGFRAVGLQQGDCVCIHSFNHLYYPILVLGIVAFGGMFVGTNPGYTSFELEHAIKTSKAKLVIAEPELLGAPKETTRRLGIPDEKILLLSDSGDASHASWRSLLQCGEQDWVRFDDLETAKNTTAFLMFSSGTTGLPKAAQLSHYNLIAEHTLVHENPRHPEPYHICMVGALPFFHAAQAPFTHTSCLRSGYETYVMRRFALWEFLDNVLKYSITRLMLVPPMVVAIVNAGKDDEARVRGSLRSVANIVGGAAPLDSETQSKLQTFLPAKSVFTQLWAMTETSCIASYFYYPESDDTGSVGRFMPNLDAKIVDDDGREIGPYDVRGELCVRGPTVIRGYLNNAEANSRDWDADNFFHTGDIALCDSQTKLWYIVDRKKELIKVRGFQVAPSELEGVLLTNSKVRDAAVIGIDGGEAGELPRAYIVRQPQVELSERDVMSWLDERLARYKRLDGGVKFVESIPKTASGKILKRILREQAKNEIKPKL